MYTIVLHVVCTRGIARTALSLSSPSRSSPFKSRLLSPKDSLILAATPRSRSTLPSSGHLARPLTHSRARPLTHGLHTYTPDFLPFGDPRRASICENSPWGKRTLFAGPLKIRVRRYISAVVPACGTAWLLRESSSRPCGCRGAPRGPNGAVSVLACRAVQVRWDSLLISSTTSRCA